MSDLAHDYLMVIIEYADEINPCSCVRYSDGELEYCQDDGEICEKDVFDSVERIQQILDEENPILISQRRYMNTDPIEFGEAEIAMVEKTHLPF